MSSPTGRNESNPELQNFPTRIPFGVVLMVMLKTGLSYVEVMESLKWTWEGKEAKKP
jgi:hypothetical protein